MGSGRVSFAVRLLAAAMVAIPGVGIAVLIIREMLAEDAAFSFNQVFHGGLAVVLLLLTADYLIAIRKSGAMSRATALGAAGCVNVTAAAILSEMLGPPVLLVLAVGAAAWTALLMRPAPAIVNGRIGRPADG